MKTSTIPDKPDIRAAFLFWSCLFVSCAFCLPAGLRGDGFDGVDLSVDPSAVPATGAPQGKEFPSSVGLYVWTEGLSSGAGAVELKAKSEIVIKLENPPAAPSGSPSGAGTVFYGVESTGNAPVTTRNTDLVLSGTATQSNQWVSSGTTVYLPVSTQQEISFHDITTSNLSRFKVHVNVPSEYAVWFYNEGLRCYEESSAYECDGATDHILFFVKLRKEQGMPAGKPLDIMPGESSLRIGLGYLRNGQSAGYLDFSPVSKVGSRDVMGSILADDLGGLSSTDFRLDLPGRMVAPFYCFPTSPDVQLVFEEFTSPEGQQNRRLKQIKTPSVLVDIIRKRDDGTDYVVNFYDASTAATEPFVTYEFSTYFGNPDGSWQMKTDIRRTEGASDQYASFRQDSYGTTFTVTETIEEGKFLGLTIVTLDMCIPVEVYDWLPVGQECEDVPDDNTDSGQSGEDADDEDSTHQECSDTYGYVFIGMDYDCPEPDEVWEPVTYSEETDDIPLPRKVISIKGFNGQRTEYRAVNCNVRDALRDSINATGHDVTVTSDIDGSFNGDSFQMVSTDASARLVGRYGAGLSSASTREVAFQMANSEDWSFAPDLVSGDYGYRTDRQYYDIDLGTGAKYPGRLFWEENPDRSWSMRGYYTDLDKRGLVSKVVTPFGDTSRPDTLPDGNAANYCMKTIDYAVDWNGAVRLPAVEENWVNGIRVSRVEHAYATAGTVNGQPVWQATTTAWADSSPDVKQTSIVKVYQGQNIDPMYRGLPYSMQAADGTKTCYAYDMDGLDDDQDYFDGYPLGGTFHSIMVTGIAASGGAMRIPDCDSWQKIDAITFVDGRSMRTDTIRNARGLVVAVKTYVYNNGAWALLDTEKRTYDAASNLLSTENSTGKAEYAYTINGRLQSSTDTSGVTTEYTYDDFGRVTSTLRKAMGDEVSALLIQFTYDADGRVKTKTIGSPDSGEQLKSAYNYNFYGQLESKTEQGITTKYSYEKDGGKIISVTETRADGSTITTKKNRDGTPQSRTGSAIVDEYYEYTIEDANLAVKTSYGSSGSDRWGKTWKDGFGRVVQTQAPLAAGISTVQNTYNAKGQLEKASTSGYANTLYAYDQMGAVTDKTLSNSSITDANGRRTGAIVKIVQQDSAWWSYAEALAYPTAGSPGVTASRTWTRLTGFDSVSIPQNPSLPATGKVVAETITQDAAGNKTRSLVLVDRGTGNRYDISTIAVGSVPSLTLSRGGLVLQSVTSSNVKSSIKYDGLFRPKRIEDRTSASPKYFGDHITYVPGTTRKLETRNNLGDLVARFAYDSVGRVITTSAPTVTYSGAGVPSAANEGTTNDTYYEYNARGQTTRVHGTATNPVRYEFDPVNGDLTAQTTYRDESEATGDTTTFVRNPADGSLTSRTDAQGNIISYAYNIRSQIDTIQSARTIETIGRITTTYGYDDATGDLTSVSYNDGTPVIAYTYDRMGRTTSVTDATGSRQFTYRPSDLRIDSEYLGRNAFGQSDSGGVYGSNLALTYFYGVVNNQPASVNEGFVVTNGSKNDYYYTITRDDLSGRLEYITTDAGEYNFDYLPDSDFIAHIGESTRHAWGQTRAYEDNRDLLASITTLNGPTTVAAYDYASDAVSRRYQIVQTGQIFDPYCADGQEMVTQYAYDNRSQVTAAVTGLAPTPPASASASPSPLTLTSVLSGRSFSYTYDAMGNRTTETANGETRGYDVNNLNQYTRRDTGATIPASGIATTGSNTPVTIDGTPLTKEDWKNSYFFKAIPKKDTEHGGPQTLRFEATTGGQTYTSTRHLLVRPQSEPFTYDADGNLLADGLWDYRYNAADQLSEATSKFPDQTGKKVLIRFTYDYMGRRAAKTAYDADTGALRSKTIFVYQGWALIAEYSADSTSSSSSPLILKRSFTWGPDLTGGADAGGIGGLLAIQDYRNMYEGIYNPTFDGNGNVTALIHAQTGTLAAAYEYDAYGNTVRTSGAYAMENPIRFSSKYQDAETGLLYYGFRYYSPSMGRFINRDPLKEAGGLNIYAMTSNNPIGKWDYLGMDTNGDYYIDTDDEHGDSSYGDGNDDGNDRGNDGGDASGRNFNDFVNDYFSGTYGGNLLTSGQSFGDLTGTNNPMDLFNPANNMPSNLLTGSNVNLTGGDASMSDYSDVGASGSGRSGASNRNMDDAFVCPPSWPDVTINRADALNMLKQPVQDSNSNLVKNKALQAFGQAAGSLSSEIIFATQNPTLSYTLNTWATNGADAGMSLGNGLLKGCCSLFNYCFKTNFSCSGYTVGNVSLCSTSILNVGYNSFNNTYSTYYSLSQKSVSNSLQIHTSSSYYKFPATFGPSYSIGNSYGKFTVDAYVKLDFSGVSSWGYGISYGLTW